MSCEVTREQLWSWIDRDAPELGAHLAVCPRCHEAAAEIRGEIGLLASDALLEPAPLPVKIGNYAIRRLIGEGGQAFVFEAEQPSPKRAVALKVMKGGPYVGWRDRRRFQLEIQALAALRHPSIASIYEAGQTPDGSLFFAMELVEGTPLHLYLREHAPSIEEQISLFLRICEAVQFAHEHGVLHRDLKPSNILVDATGMPHVLDFGLARHDRPPEGLTATESGALEGTPRYLSPERIRRHGDPVDARADVYSLGVILYEALTGRPPHEADSLDPATLRRICEDPPPLPSQFDPRLRGDLESILLRALEKEPKHRYPSVEALAADLRRFQAGAPVRPEKPPILLRFRRAVWRHPFRAGTIVLLIGVMVPAGLIRRHEAKARARTQILMVDAFARLLQDPENPTLAREVGNLAVELPGRIDVVLIAAQANCLDQEYRFAIEQLREELGRRPAAWPLRLLLVEVLDRVGRTAEAATERERLPGKVPDDAESWYLRTLATLDPERALAAARESIRRNGEDERHLRVYFARARAAHSDGEAADCAGRLARRKGADWTCWTDLRAESLVRAGRYEDAIRSLDSLLLITPHERWRFHQRAVAGRLLGRYEDAERDYSRAIAAAPSEAEAAWAIYHRGTVNQILGRTEEAIADFRRVHRILAYATYANARLVLCLRELGREAEADAALREARAGLLQNPWLGTIFRCLAGELTPEQLLAAADSTNPTQRCEGLFYAAEVARATGRTKEAERWFQQCADLGIRRDPGRPSEVMSETELAAWRLGRLP